MRRPFARGSIYHPFGLAVLVTLVGLLIALGLDYGTPSMLHDWVIFQWTLPLLLQASPIIVAVLGIIGYTEVALQRRPDVLAKTGAPNLFLIWALAWVGLTENEQLVTTSVFGAFFTFAWLITAGVSVGVQIYLRMTRIKYIPPTKHRHLP